MSERQGLDFNGDGKVSFTESHQTYNIIRNGAMNNSYSSSSYRPPRSSSGGSDNNTIITTSGKTSKFKTHFIRFFLILLVIIMLTAVVIGISDYLHARKRDSDYNTVISLITSGDYDMAIDITRGYYDNSEFRCLEYAAYLFKYDEESDGFTDCSKFDLDSFQSSLKWASYCNDNFISSYIDGLKERENEIIKRYEDYLEQPILDEIKENPPYRLMKTKYIDKTILGEHDKVENIMLADYLDPYTCLDPEAAKTAPGKIYTFFGNGETYYVLCSETLVIEVSINKRFETRESTSKKDNGSSKTTTDYDKYDTSRFYWAEDFYDFYYDDFRDFDEAKEYFEEHKER